MSDIDYWNLYAREVLGMPESWAWHDLEGYGSDRASGGAHVRGNIPGDPPTHERELVVSFREYDAFVATKKEESK